MGLLLRVEQGTAVHEEKLDLEELEALELAAEQNEALKSAFAIVFEVPEPSNSKQVPLSALVGAIDVILRDGKSALKVPIYYIYDSPMPGFPPGAASGAGLTIAGQRCCIMGGANQCSIMKYAQDERGEWKLVSTEDVRHLKVIRCDEQGDIEIRKRYRPNRTLQLLRRLKNALSEASPASLVRLTLG